MTRSTAIGRQAERFLQFEQCPHCSYDIVTGEGERSCHDYECAYLPEELDTRCPTCNHNFLTGDTDRGCGPEPCDFAVREAPQRVANVRRWEESRRAKAQASSPVGV